MILLPKNARRSLLPTAPCSKDLWVRANHWKNVSVLDPGEQ